MHELLDPLVHAVRQGLRNTCRQLLLHGLDEERSLFRKNIALCEAVRAGDVDVCELLLQHGALPNFKEPFILHFSPWRREPLCVAAHSGQLRICRLILRHVTGAPSALGCALIEAAKAGHLHVCEELLPRVDCAEYNIADIEFASARLSEWQKFPDMLPSRYVLTYALGKAVINNHVEVCRLLLTRGSRTNVQHVLSLLQTDHTAAQTQPETDFTPITSGDALIACARLGHFRICELLLQYGKDERIIIKGSHPLGVAAANGHADLCKLMLAHGLPVNGPQSRRLPRFRPALSAAATKGHLEVCRVLLDAGADPNLLDNWNHKIEEGFPQVYDDRLLCNQQEVEMLFY